MNASFSDGPISVEKVLSSVGTNFLRTAGALGVLGRRGPLQLERIQPVTFADALRGHSQRNSATSLLLRKFCCGGIFDFFNRIGLWKTTTFVAGITSAGIILPWVLDGPINRDAFEIYVGEVLIPDLRPGAIVVMDNGR